MFSIEEKYNMNKLKFNKSFSCIEIKHGNSTEMLAEIDFTSPSIIWLDYDNVLSMTCFADIKILFDALPHGSIFVMSCNRQLRNDEADPIRPYTRDELNAKFTNLVPYDIEDSCCADINASQTIRRMLEAYCNKVIEDRNRLGKDKLSFYPLYNIKYEEYRGARMFTYGGIILNSDYDIDKLNVYDFKFINTGGPYEISIPNITYREATELNKIMDNKNDEQQKVSDRVTDMQIKVTDKRKVIVEKVVAKALENGDKLTSNRITILQLMAENPYITKIELAAAVGISATSIMRNIEYMRNKYLRRVGPDNGGFWEIIE